MDLDELIARIKAATEQFAAEQSVLLIQDAHEEALSSQYLRYLVVHFSDLELDIDSQYNKRIFENEIVNKQSEFLITNLPIAYWPKTWRDDQTLIKKEILPDIIIHDRQSHERNFLVAELKKTTNKNASDRKWDQLKLQTMTSIDLNYRYGIFIDFKTGTEYSEVKPFFLTFYVNGEVVHTE